MNTFTNKISKYTYNTVVTKKQYGKWDGLLTSTNHESPLWLEFYWLRKCNFNDTTHFAIIHIFLTVISSIIHNVGRLHIRWHEPFLQSSVNVHSWYHSDLLWLVKTCLPRGGSRASATQTRAPDTSFESFPVIYRKTLENIRLVWANYANPLCILCRTKSVSFESVV